MLLTYEYWLISRIIIIPLIFIIGIFLIAQGKYTKTEDGQILMSILIVMTIPIIGEIFAVIGSILAFYTAGTYIIIHASDFIRNKIRNQSQS